MRWIERKSRKRLQDCRSAEYRVHTTHPAILEIQKNVRSWNKTICQSNVFRRTHLAMYHSSRIQTRRARGIEPSRTYMGLSPRLSVHSTMDFPHSQMFCSLIAEIEIVVLLKLGTRQRTVSGGAPLAWIPTINRLKREHTDRDAV